MIAELKKVPDPLRDPGHLFRSALVSTIPESITRHRHCRLFTECTVSNISSLLLLRDFPFT